MSTDLCVCMCYLSATTYYVFTIFYSFYMLYISEKTVLPPGAWGGITTATFVVGIVAGLAVGLLIGICCGYKLKDCFSDISVSNDDVSMCQSMLFYMACSVRLK